MSSRHGTQTVGDIDRDEGRIVCGDAECLTAAVQCSHRTPEEIIEAQRELIATLLVEKLQVIRERDHARDLLQLLCPDEPLWFGEDA